MVDNHDNAIKDDFIVLPNISHMQKVNFDLAFEQAVEERLPQRTFPTPLAPVVPDIWINHRLHQEGAYFVNGSIEIDQQVANTTKNGGGVKPQAGEEAQPHSHPSTKQPTSTLKSLVPSPSLPLPSSPQLTTIDMPAQARQKAVRVKSSPNLNDLVLPAAILPENTSITLIHQTHDDAIRAVKETCLKWSAPKPDPSIPTSDKVRRAYVCRLVLAFFNREALQNMGHGRGKRWEDVKAHYPQAAVEKVCWDIVHIAERLHDEGPSFLSIHDLHMQKEIYQDRKLTFEERMQFLIKLLCFYKSKCEDFMKGAQAEEIVACPKQKLSACKINLKQNKGRAIVLKKGREANAAEAAQDEQNDADAPVEPVLNDSIDAQVTVQEKGTGSKADVTDAECDVNMEDCGVEEEATGESSVIESVEAKFAMAAAPSPRHSGLWASTLKRPSSDIPSNECDTEKAESETKRARLEQSALTGEARDFAEF